MHREYNIEISDINKFIKETEKNRPFIYIDGNDIWELGFNTKPFIEYDIPENFPKCCNYHNDVKNGIEKWFNKFPYCCKNHQALTNKNWFSKDKYNHIPEKVLRQLSYTENFISETINKDNWYKEITDYISYTLDSFGTPNIGGGKYYQYIKHWIEEINPNDFTFESRKRKQLIEFLDNLFKPIPSKPTADLNILYSIFQKWLKAFPNLPFFLTIKKRFTNKIPLNVFLFDPEHNRFTGLSKFKMRTHSELIEILINTTKNLLQQINTPELIKKGIINDSNKYQIDILNEQHSLKQKQLLIEFTEKETKYLKIIKKWLKNEKEYMKNLQPFLKNESIMPKLFTIEKKEIFETEYLKVFIRKTETIDEVANYISTLQSVRKANVTKNKVTDITVYPAKTYTADETATEIDIALSYYYSKGIFDPIFEDKISLLSEEAFENILDLIYNYGQNLEKFSDLYDKFDEEGFRDFFLPHLNTISKSHSATGETFNKIGKTDMLIQDEEGNNVFIAECKLWKGESELNKAIDQLLERYVTWRDEKVALIVFNKEMKKFSELLIKAVTKLQTHSLFKEYIGQTRETSHRFVFRHPEDPDKLIQLELIVFNCV